MVVTKDRDFRDGHLLAGSPRKLFIVATGNISNDALLKLFEVHLGAATSALQELSFVELRAKFLVVHPRRDHSPEAVLRAFGRPQGTPVRVARTAEITSTYTPGGRQSP